MGLFVIGLNHKDCPVEVRERLHFTPRKLDAGLACIATADQFSGAMILSTCNRVEFYGYTDAGGIPEHRYFAMMKEIHGAEHRDFERYLYRYQDQEMLRHLFRVAAGLDSLVIGENEILGQLRDAFRTARNAGCLGPRLQRLVEKALKVGKEARSETLINKGAISIPSIAVKLAEKVFGKLTSENVMVLGTGEMAMLTVKKLKTAGAMIRYVVSHSRERAEKLTGECGGEWVSFDTWEEKISGADIFITATSCPHPIVRRPQIQKLMAERRHRPLFLIDIAVPRNIDPSVHQLNDVHLYNIDDLKSVADHNLKCRSREIEKIEAMIDKAMVSSESWLHRVEIKPGDGPLVPFFGVALEMLSKGAEDPASFAECSGIDLGLKHEASAGA